MTNASALQNLGLEFNTWVAASLDPWNLAQPFSGSVPSLDEHAKSRGGLH